MELRPGLRVTLAVVRGRARGCFALVLVLLLLAPMPSMARTWRVAKDGSGDFSVIQAAVDVAAPGDTVFIAAGRYAESETTSAWAPPDRVACVVVSVDSLTLIGEDPERVIVGPETYEYWNYGPLGIGGVTSLVSFLRIERIGFVNNYSHVYKRVGAIEMRECRVQRGGYGAHLFDLESSLVDSCLFEDCLGGISLTRCQDSVVRDCRLVQSAATGRAAIYIMTSNGILVEDCFVMGGFVGIAFDWSTGSILRCRTSGNLSYGISGYGSGTDVLVEDCSATNSPEPLRVESLVASFRGNRCIFSGGSSATASFAQSNVALRDCHILNGGGGSVRLDDDIRSSPGTYDLAGNWWGTTDSEQIDAWIHDANDNPQVGAVVQYQPFLDHPVGTERKTLGGIKGMFR